MLREELHIDMTKAQADLAAFARELGLEGSAEALQKSVTTQIYDEVLKPRVTRANPVLSGAAPNIRDIKAQTYAYITDESDENKAVVAFVSDSKDPDALPITGTRARKIGRPKGSKNGVNNQRTTYANGVDMSNVTNGQLSAKRGTPGYRSQRKTGRAVPMPSQGWWLRGLKAAVKTVVTG